MNKKMQLILTMMVTFASVIVASERGDEPIKGGSAGSKEEETYQIPPITITGTSTRIPKGGMDTLRYKQWVDIPLDTAADMKKKLGDRITTERIYGDNPEARGFLREEWDTYLSEKRQQGEKIPWSGRNKVAIHWDTAIRMRSHGHGPSQQEIEKVKGGKFALANEDDYGNFMNWVTPEERETFPKQKQSQPSWERISSFPEKWMDVPRDTAKDMQQQAGDRRIPMTFDEEGNIQVMLKDWQQYTNEKHQKGEKIPWRGGESTVIPLTKVSTLIPVSATVANEITKNQQKANVSVGLEKRGDNYMVREDDYNKYYYNQLPWYKRWFGGLFSSKPSSNSSGVLKSYASVTLPTNQTRQPSRITMPKAFVPTPKTLERAKKLETPYIPAASAKDSASKALKRAERFGGYQ